MCPALSISKLFYIANFSFLRLKRWSILDIFLKKTGKFEAKHWECFWEKFVKQFVGPLTRLIKLIVKLKTSTLSDLLHSMQQETLLQFLGGICQKYCYKTENSHFFSMHYCLLVNSFLLDNIFQKRLGQNLLQPGRF